MYGSETLWKSKSRIHFTSTRILKEKFIEIHIVDYFTNHILNIILINLWNKT